MTIKKPSRTIIALIAVLVLAALVGGFYWKSKKVDETKKLGAEQQTEDATTPEEEMQYDCVNCQDDDSREEDYPKEPLNMTPETSTLTVTQS